MKNFTRPIICESCHNFYAIPQTCLLNVRCDKCSVTYCGECYYEYLGPVQRKRYIFEDLINDDVLQQMQ